MASLPQGTANNVVKSVSPCGMGGVLWDGWNFVGWMGGVLWGGWSFVGWVEFCGIGGVLWNRWGFVVGFCGVSGFFALWRGFVCCWESL